MLVDIATLKEHLGGIQSKLNFDTVLPFVKTAEYNFSKEIGKELYAALPTYPLASADQEVQDKQTWLLYFAKSCVAWLAYDMAVPHLKFRVGDLGMMKTVPANTTSITKWEYVDTRESNMAMADAARENFYELLEELSPTEWTESPKYEVRHNLFIHSPQILGQYVVLAGRNIRFFNQLAVYIRKSEELYISELITESVFVDLKAKISDPNATLSAVEKKLLEHIRKALASLAIQEALPFLQVKVDEDGMREVRKKDGIREEEIADKGYRNRTLRALSNDGDLYLARLRKFMDSTASATVFESYYTANLATTDAFIEDYSGKSHIIF